MAARTGLSTLILRLRGMADAGTADYTLGAAVYWDDDQCQTVLDNYRMSIHGDRLVPYPEQSAGSAIWLEYHSHFPNWEATTGGTAVFVVRDSVGNIQGTANYSVDYANGVVTFNSDQRGTAYFLTGISYDLNGAASDIWMQKAGQAAKLFAFSAGPHTLSRQQVYEHCIKMSDLFASRALPVLSTILRGDEPRG